MQSRPAVSTSESRSAIPHEECEARRAEQRPEHAEAKLGERHLRHRGRVLRVLQRHAGRISIHRASP